MSKSWKNIGLILETLEDAKKTRKITEFKYVEILNAVERICLCNEQTAKNYIKQMLRQGILIGKMQNRIFEVNTTLDEIERMKAT